MEPPQQPRPRYIELFCVLGFLISRMVLVSLLHFLIIIVLFLCFVYVVFKYFLYDVWYFYFNFILGMEYAETSSSGVRDIGKIIKRYFPSKSVFYDLGSGRWSLLFPLSKIVPECDFFGIEDIPFQIRFCRFIQYFRRNKTNLHFVQDNFSTMDISWANILFLYVPNIFLPNLKKILQAKMSQKQILILYRISFKNWKPIEIIPTDFVNGISQNNIYIYQNI